MLFIALFAVGWVLIELIDLKGVQLGLVTPTEAAIWETLYVITGSVWIALAEER